jgi:hypothetical protein
LKTEGEFSLMTKLRINNVIPQLASIALTRVTD